MHFCTALSSSIMQSGYPRLSAGQKVVWDDGLAFSSHPFMTSQAQVPQTNKASPKYHAPCHAPMHQCHARPRQPVVPNHFLTGTQPGVFGLHDTAAKSKDLAYYLGGPLFLFRSELIVMTRPMRAWLTIQSVVWCLLMAA